MGGRAEIIQTSALLRSARILRRVLETCFHSDSSEKALANASVKTQEEEEEEEEEEDQQQQQLQNNDYKTKKNKKIIQLCMAPPSGMS